MYDIPRIEDPRAAAWTRDNYDMVADFTLDVHGPDPESHVFNAFCIHTIACRIWCDARGRPAWKQVVDLEALIDDMSGTPGWCEDMQAEVVSTWLAFYGFLVRRGTLGGRDVAPMMLQLEALLRATLEPRPDGWVYLGLLDAQKRAEEPDIQWLN
jgi:hypothetical protein